MTLPASQMDSRLKLLSHSSLCLLHTCPRKYQLTKCAVETTRDTTVHTEFGKAFGEGIQALLSGVSLQDAVLRAVTQWSLDLEEEVPTKSIWNCIAALEHFNTIKHTTVLDDYEVARFGKDNKLACELSFCIALPDGFYYRGYVDVVLRHKLTGSYLVVDVKTSGANYSNPAKYINSPQAIGYSIVMDLIEPDYSQYDVMYYEYLTATKKYIEHTFVVGNLQRAQWLRNILVDLNIMKMYDNYDEWPMHGESCASYNRACQFLDTCTMKTSSLCGNRHETVDALELDREQNYDVIVSFEDLVSSQLNRV